MNQSNTLQYYDGTLLYKEYPLVSFKVSNGQCIAWKLYPENTQHLPLELQDAETYRNLLAFLSWRLLPATRQNLEEVLTNLGMKSYSWDELLRTNYGLNTDDYYWFREATSNLAYEDIKIRE